MRFLFLAITLFLIPTSVLLAQESVGFSDSVDIDPLLDYRLPDWGYSNLVLDVDLVGESAYSKFNGSGQSVNNRSRNYQFYLNPSYNIYRESEKRIITLASDFSISYQDRFDKSEDSDIAERARSNFDSDINISGDLKEYLNSQLFVLVSGDGRFSYEKDGMEDWENGSLTDQEDEYTRRFSSDTRLGVGFGRIRNVTPIVRAMRLNERYKTIAPGDNFNSEEVQAAADQFTRYNGYQSRYDRPQKHFWEGMDQAVNSSLSELDAFDLFYLQDVLNESLGQRYQGWEVRGGGFFSYINRLIRVEQPFENPTLERSKHIGKTGGIFIGARGFKNLSLKHQLGFNVNIEREYSLDDSSLKWDNYVTGNLSWLWNVADRFLLNTHFNNRFHKYKIDSDASLSADLRWNYSSILSTNFIYFIENRLAFNGLIAYQMSHNGDSDSDFTFSRKNFGIQFRAGVTYYFDRKLF